MLLIEVVIQSLQEKVVNTYMLVGDKVLMRHTSEPLFDSKHKKAIKGNTTHTNRETRTKAQNLANCKLLYKCLESLQGPMKKKTNKKRASIIEIRLIQLTEAHA